MRISTKLSVFYVAVLAVFCVLTVALLAQLRAVSLSYDALLNSPVRQMDETRVIQVDFEKQVLEWQDILLRGHNSEDLAKYTKQFHDSEQQVRAEAKALTNAVDDEEAKRLLEQFAAVHLILSQKYQQAYEAYLAGKADFKAADKIIRGQDRPPTVLFDQVVRRLDTRVKESVEAQWKSVLWNRNLAIGVTGGLLLLLSVVGFLIVRDIQARLAHLKAVSDRLAKADISGLVVDISGSDEIGEFGQSMKGVHAAIEELLTVTSAHAAG